jgi:mono/diheme cytochrome c family protein
MDRSRALAPWLLWVVVAASRPATAGPVDYAREIQPILAERCTECHGRQKQQSGLRLDGLSYLLRGGDSGPAVVAGRGAESLLYRAIAGASEDVATMPPEGKRLTPEQIALIRKWIDEGAKGPTGRSRNAPAIGHEPSAIANP